MKLRVINNYYRLNQEATLDAMFAKRPFCFWIPERLNDLGAFEINWKEPNG